MGGPLFMSVRTAAAERKPGGRAEAGPPGRSELSGSRWRRMAHAGKEPGAGFGYRRTHTEALRGGKGAEGGVPFPPCRATR